MRRAKPEKQIRDDILLEFALSYMTGIYCEFKFQQLVLGHTCINRIFVYVYGLFFKGMHWVPRILQVGLSCSGRLKIMITCNSFYLYKHRPNLLIKNKIQ